MNKIWVKTYQWRQSIEQGLPENGPLDAYQID